MHPAVASLASKHQSIVQYDLGGLASQSPPRTEVLRCPVRHCHTPASSNTRPQRPLQRSVPPRHCPLSRILPPLSRGRPHSLDRCRRRWSRPQRAVDQTVPRNAGIRPPLQPNPLTNVTHRRSRHVQRDFFGAPPAILIARCSHPDLAQDGDLPRSLPMLPQDCAPRRLLQGSTSPLFFTCPFYISSTYCVLRSSYLSVFPIVILYSTCTSTYLAHK